jgi:hypothetical protein
MKADSASKSQREAGPDPELAARSTLWSSVGTLAGAHRPLPRSPELGQPPRADGAGMAVSCLRRLDRW